MRKSYGFGFGESAHLLGLIWAFITVQNSYVVAQMAIDANLWTELC